MYLFYKLRQKEILLAESHIKQYYGEEKSFNLTEDDDNEVPFLSTIHGDDDEDDEEE
jgi:hypothetical protein